MNITAPYRADPKLTLLGLDLLATFLLDPLGDLNLGTKAEASGLSAELEALNRRVD